MKYSVLFVLCLSIIMNVAIAQWAQTNGPYAGSVGVLYKDGSTVFAGTIGAGVFRSTDSGVSWTQSSSGITALSVLNIMKSGSYLLATGTEGFYRSSDNGDTWNSVVELPYVVNVLAGNDANVIAGTNGKGIFVSTDNGGTWTGANNGLPFTGDRFSVTAVVANGSTFYMSATNNSSYGIYKTTDLGSSWATVSSGLPGFTSFYSFCVQGSTMYVGGASIYKTTNSGASWTETATGLPPQPAVSAMLVVDDTIFAGAVNGVYRSTNNGVSWSTSDTLTLSSGVSCLVNMDNTMLVGTRGRGVFSSTDGGNTWRQSSSGLLAQRTTRLMNIGSSLFAFGNGVYVSPDNGANWSSADSGLPKNFYDVNAVGKSNTSMFLAVLYTLYRSTDNGVVWNQVTSGLPSFFTATSILSSGSNLYMTCNDVYKSTDDGASWTAMNTGLYAGSIVEYGGTLFVGTNQGMSRSTNQGTTWSTINTGLPNFFNVASVTLFGSDLFIAENYGSRIYKSTNNGDSWASVTNLPGSNPVQSLLVVGNDLYGTSSNGGIFISKNRGSSWSKISTGLPQTTLFPIIVANGYLYSGTDGNSIWKRQLTDFTAVHEIPDAVPSGFSLSQNYPNPFNPTTNFTFQILDFGLVTLRIYDVVGREVATVVNDNLHPGTYTASWDASGQPSGVYYYRLMSGAGSEIKKMVLTK